MLTALQQNGIVIYLSWVIYFSAANFGLWMSSFKNKSNHESLELLQESFNKQTVIWCLVIFGSNSFYVLIAWMIRRERKCILLCSYEKYVSQSQY
jgi:hypothetical protein